MALPREAVKDVQNCLQASLMASLEEYLKGDCSINEVKISVSINGEPGLVSWDVWKKIVDSLGCVFPTDELVLAAVPQRDQGGVSTDKMIATKDGFCLIALCKYDDGVAFKYILVKGEVVTSIGKLALGAIVCFLVGAAVGLSVAGTGASKTVAWTGGLVAQSTAATIIAVRSNVSTVEKEKMIKNKLDSLNGKAKAAALTMATDEGHVTMAQSDDEYIFSLMFD